MERREHRGGADGGKGFGLAALAAGAVAVFLAVSGTNGPAAEMQGYFKSENRDRVIALYAQGLVTEAAATEIFGRVTVTHGQPVLAVIYQGPACRGTG